MGSSFEIFDHTADAGIRARGGTLPELVQAATDGLYAVIGELVAKGEASTMDLDFQGSDASLLLRDYLGELLILFESGKRIATDLSVARFDDCRLEVLLNTKLVDEAKSVYHREVKAITYHELAIRRVDDGYEATMIVDI